MNDRNPEFSCLSFWISDSVGLYASSLETSHYDSMDCPMLPSSMELLSDIRTAGFG